MTRAGHPSGGRRPGTPGPRRRLAATVATGILATWVLIGCAQRPAGEPGGGAGAQSAAQPAFRSFHGVIVWLGPATFDTVRVVFDAEWVRTPLADDSSVWSFSGTDQVSGRIVTGRLHRDSLSWSLIGTVGDVTVVEEYGGGMDARGQVRGCGGVASRTRLGLPGGGPRAAFVLAPRSLPRPEPSDAPAAACRPVGP